MEREEHLLESLGISVEKREAGEDRRCSQKLFRNLLQSERAFSGSPKLDMQQRQKFANINITQ